MKSVERNTRRTMFSFLKKKKVKKTVETQVEECPNKENNPIQIDRSSSPSVPVGFITSDSPSSSRRSPCKSSSQQFAGHDLHRLLTSGYLNDDKNLGYLKRVSGNQIGSSTRPSQFHRPIGFSYNKQPSAMVNATQKKGMKALVTGQTKLRKVHCSHSSTSTAKDSSSIVIDNDPLVLSRYSGGFIPDPNAPKKIESLDWPAPIAVQAMPELLRKIVDEEEEEEEEEQRIDPISKLKDTSGMAHDLLETRPQRTVPLDPWKASRSPSASIEPSRRCRFQSPKIAAPSQRMSTDSTSNSHAQETLSTISSHPHPKVICLTRSSEQTMRHHPDAIDMERSCDLVSTTHSDDLIDTEPIKSIKTIDRDLRSERTEPSTRSAPALMSHLKIYPYKDLKVTPNKRLPSDVRRDHLEYHLSNEEFERLFQLKRADFYRLPAWRRVDLKKRLKLF